MGLLSRGLTLERAYFNSAVFTVFSSEFLLFFQMVSNKCGKVLLHADRVLLHDDYNKSCNILLHKALLEPSIHLCLLKDLSTSIVIDEKQK